MTQRRNPGAESSRAACCAHLGSLLTPGFFKALGEPSRLSILMRLAGGCGPWTVSAVAEGLPTSLSVVSRHLATLKQAGILAAERRGKEVHYRVRYGEVVRLLRELADAIEACCPEGSAEEERCV